MAGTSTGADKPVLSKQLAALARRLAALSAEDRRAVLDAASRGPSRQTASWASLEAAVGVVTLGGDALADTATLYDG
jgi:hypothetical protein